MFWLTVWSVHAACKYNFKQLIFKQGKDPLRQHHHPIKKDPQKYRHALPSKLIRQGKMNFTALM
ncbi:unnamed protein product [Prunus armeniaca]|uniref:Uncharacterized protein n=1 Tax=Prunus armeniaca TaxID=36596 RepID=A0A6J5X6F1_PRUAR|nr:unnamed protein product [Prunus armeniaca]